MVALLIAHAICHAPSITEPLQNRIRRRKGMRIDSRGPPISAANVRLNDATNVRPSARRPDIWRTISGWVWVAYLIGLAVLGVWLAWSQAAATPRAPNEAA